MCRSTEKPIAGSLNDGLTPEEYFASYCGGRKVIIDRSINTAVT
jgi:DNA-directed RNA polymerase beta' subunit